MNLKDLDILLIGKTGTGKSSTGNSVLNRNIFKFGKSTNSTTEYVEVQFSKHKDFIIKVVDVPGFFDTKLSVEASTKEIYEAMGIAIAASTYGYHAFLLVVMFGERFTQEDKNTIKVMKEIFGNDFLKRYGVLIISHGDLLEMNEIDSIQDWCLSEKGSFYDLFVECGQRAVLFNNVTKDQIKKEKQLNQLLEIVQTLSPDGKRYTNQYFQMAEKERAKLVNQNKPAIQEHNIKEASLIIQELDQLDICDRAKTLSTLHTLKSKTECMLNDLVSQDKHTGALNDIITFVTRIKVTVESYIKRLENNANQNELLTLVRELNDTVPELEKEFKELTRSTLMQYVLSIGKVLANSMLRVASIALGTLRWAVSFLRRLL